MGVFGSSSRLLKINLCDESCSACLGTDAFHLQGQLKRPSGSRPFHQHRRASVRIPTPDHPRRGPRPAHIAVFSRSSETFLTRSSSARTEIIYPRRPAARHVGMSVDVQTFGQVGEVDLESERRWVIIVKVFFRGKPVLAILVVIVVVVAG